MNENILSGGSTELEMRLVEVKTTTGRERGSGLMSQ